MKYHVIDVCRHMINYSNEKECGVSNLKLQKLLYFTQAYFLITKREACFGERIEAWDLGPVVPVANREYKQFGSSSIPTITYVIEKDTDNIWNSKVVSFHDVMISSEDKTLIDSVVDKFSEYSASDLVELTYRQKPWSDAYVPYKNNEITIKAIEEYFDAKFA